MNRKIKLTVKWLVRIIVSIMSFFIIYLIAAWGLARISIAEESGEKDEVTIYIKTNGVHTDIVVPTRNDQIDWSEEIKFSDIKSKDSIFNYLAIGWGDKGFYLETPTWAELKPSVAFRAAFGLSTTAIHTTYYKNITVDSTCLPIRISKNQYTRLIRYVFESVQVDENGHWINIKTNANYSEFDAFYEAKGRYSIFNTCNSWANKGLKKCGQRHCFWTPFDTEIFLNYQ